MSTQNSHLNFFRFGSYHKFFVLLRLTCLLTLFDRKFVFKISPKLTIFGTFNELLSNQNISFEFCNFGIFHLLELTSLVTLFDLQVFENSLKLTVSGIFNKLLSTQISQKSKWDLFWTILPTVFCDRRIPGFTVFENHSKCRIWIFEF